jgi:hypothetical protein
VSAVRAEGRLARRLEQVRSFDPSDASRRLSLAPTLSPSALGVTLSLDW